MSSIMETFNNICSYNFGQRLPKLLLLLGLSAIGVTLSLRYIKRRKIIYQKYGKVLKLIIYPIKSLPGIEIEEMEMTPSGSIAGLLRDRGWVLVDRYDRFITIRQEPSLVKLSVSFNSKSGCITVTSPSGDIIKVDAKEDDKFNKQDVIKTRIWGTPIQGIDCGPECARFFQKFLDREGIKLLRYHSNFEQRPALKFRDNEWTRDGGASIVYHDESPCLIINENSVKQLNDWLDEYKVTYKNFRPTILIEAPTFSEDLWEFMKIGDLEFYCLSKCRRCKVTTTDPSTGERHNEPLVTLRKYRSLQEHEKKMGQGPKMGIHVRSMKKWKIRVGQDVYGCNSSS